MKLGNYDNLPIINVTKNIIWLLLGFLALDGLVLLNFIILYLTYMFLRASKRKQRLQLKDSTLGPNLNHSHTKSSKKLLKDSTKSSKEACGTIYRGYFGLKLTRSPYLAVNKLRDFQLEIEKEFANELKSICQTHHKNLTRTNTWIRGTKVYDAPEWFRNSGINAKVDVYCFGVMVLEILFCRRNVEKDIDEKVLLIFWVSDCYDDGQIDALVEGDEEAMEDMGRLQRFVMVALWCV
ncbi:G-type lectin S-receptor-like serine/threonine-protein kinase LECRK4 [Dendrobium catenatum]|uniref:G-type lectin S-receptor-like serine/threonine-protein kinase LECRK4 n=1 Tax=Dendrobium catenatum TaxID=906689 RepID=UPI0010A0AD04|nr:G-type lectin S-receptor-like serine/threonine-protein kinase LECRK4 [Dendrobium catenatum]